MGACFSSPPTAGDADRPRRRTPNEKRAAPDGGKEGAVRVEFGYERDFQGRYEVGRLLGHGQFGYTFTATDRHSGDRVAVKRIDKAKMDRPVAVEDVKREVKILKALKGHENIVHFYNAFEDDSYVYIVMELCEGGELLDRILAKKNSRYSEKDAAVVVRQMLKVAAECHLRGLVHRDMKPENFLFKSTKEDSPLKATDFGLSDFIKPGKKFHDIVGSAYYVAPEVLKRRSGPESDVWSIGVITYILLCGRRPFWDKTEDGIFKEVLRNKPDFRKRPWPSISPSAKDFVKRLLVKNPRARLTAAQALSHPWVREGGDASEIPVDISVLSNMRQFVKYSRFKQFALRALASTLNEEDLADLKDQFDAIDVDKSGSISIEEMRHALAKDLPWRLKGPRVLEIIQAIDSNTDGLVDFKEFVAATLHVHQMAELDSERWPLLVLAATAGAVTFDATNDVPNTPGGAKFDQAVGADYAKQALSAASSFIWNIFNQPNPGDRRSFDSVTLTVVGDISAPNIAAVTSGNAIRFNDKYVANWQGDAESIKEEVTGVLYHEVTHVWQWDGQGTANRGLVEGIADFVRLKAKLAPGHWVTSGQGDRWDQGYDVTAWFLDYCESLKQGFVAELNAKMKDGYSDDFFVQILGKNVQQLWQDYKANHRG